jgi:hypothetical protein
VSSWFSDRRQSWRQEEGGKRKTVKTPNAIRLSPWVAAVWNACGIVLCAAWLLLSVLPACKNEPSGPSSESSIVRGPAPLLKDTIPYARLGSGRLAFKRYTPFNGDAFYVLDALHNSSTGIAVGGSVMFPAISPDGEKLACTFSAGLHDPGWPWDIGVMRIDGSGFQHVTEMSDYEECPSWSADGAIIFYYHRAAFSELYCQSPIPHAPDSRVVSPLTRVTPRSPVSASAMGSLVLSGEAEGGEGIIAVDSKGATLVIARDT